MCSPSAVASSSLANKVKKKRKGEGSYYDSGARVHSRSTWVTRNNSIFVAPNYYLLEGQNYGSLFRGRRVLVFVENLIWYPDLMRRMREFLHNGDVRSELRPCPSKRDLCVFILHCVQL